MENLSFMMAPLFSSKLLLVLFFGTLFGLILGVLPGLGPTTGGALILPFTMTLDPLSAIVLLTAIYCAGTYGGAITAILINTPGTPAAAATCLDGYPLAQKGEAGIYSLSATSSARSSIVLAIGRTETRGEFLTVGASQGQCPVTLKAEEEISESRALQLIGMKESGAEVCAAANRWLYRVGERDGEPFAVTMDYRPNRVTVSVRSGTISAVTVG